MSAAAAAAEVSEASHKAAVRKVVETYIAGQDVFCSTSCELQKLVCLLFMLEEIVQEKPIVTAIMKDQVTNLMCVKLLTRLLTM